MYIPFRRYRIKLDGSGRIIDRNRRFLRSYKGDQNLHNNTEDLIITSPTTNSTSEDNQHTLSDTNDTTEQTSDLPRSDIPKELLPFNKPGISEQNIWFDRRTTRSGKDY